MPGHQGLFVFDCLPDDDILLYQPNEFVQYKFIEHNFSMTF